METSEEIEIDIRRFYFILPCKYYNFDWTIGAMKAATDGFCYLCDLCDYHVPDEDSIVMHLQEEHDLY